MSSMNAAELVHDWDGRPIPGCPGRWVLRAAARLSPEALSRTTPRLRARTAGARDEVIITVLADGGLISYAKPDGTFVHTANDRDGFARKLAALGITLAS